jgi:hypothetical protein
MITLSKILTGAAGLAIVASAAPASAQYAPNNGYNNGGVIGAVINSVLGGGRYGAYGQGADRNAVDQCARAAEARVSRDYRPNGYGYNQQSGYNQNGYGNQMARAQVVGITGVERRSNGLKVSGLINSGRYGNAYGNQGYGNQGYGNQGFGNGYPNQGYPNQGYANPNYANNAQRADMSFSCRVDARGYVSNVKIDRMAYRRG